MQCPLSMQPIPEQDLLQPVSGTKEVVKRRKFKTELLGGAPLLPAPGVMQTNPVIIPWMAPIAEGFLKKNVSQKVHTRRLVVAHI